jgi:hypothetical protein
MLAAVQLNGFALEDASEDLRKDRDVVLAAVQQNGLALQYASEDLRKDRDVVLAAMQQDGAALAYASPKLKADIVNMSNFKDFTISSNKRNEFKTGKSISSSSSAPGTKKNLLKL